MYLTVRIAVVMSLRELTQSHLQKRNLLVSITGECGVQVQFDPGA